MDRHPTQPRQHPITQDIPLPGNYPCLTLQLNITRYAVTGATRAVLIVREPSEHVEVKRVSWDVPGDEPGVSLKLSLMLDQALADMHWLQLGTIND